MMSRFTTLICLLLLSLIITGCATTSGSSQGSNNPAVAQAAQVNTALGREYMDRGQLEIALDKLKKAIRIDPDYVPAHTMLGILYEQIKEPRLATQHYRKAVEIKPKNGDANNNYGVHLCNTGKADEADQYFMTAVNDPFYRTPEVAYANAGTCALQLNKLDKAYTYLRKSLEYNANFADALFPLADINYRQEEFLKARAFLQRYEAVRPASPESLLLGYRIENQLGDRKSAEKYMSELRTQFPDSDQYNQTENP